MKRFGSQAGSPRCKGIYKMSPERPDFSGPEDSTTPSPTVAEPVSPRMLAVCEYGQESPESAGETPHDDDLTSLSWLQDNDLLKRMNLSKPESDESPSESCDASSTPPPKAYSTSSNMSNISSNSSNSSHHVDQSPTSDYVDESSASAAESCSSTLSSPATLTSAGAGAGGGGGGGYAGPRAKHPYNEPYNPLVHTSSKPPYSFSCLIFMAIEDSKLKALPVKEIYAWILEHFPYFKTAPTGWKNSVRHNLSLSKCFQKVEKAPNLGKGSLWMVDQQYRPNLLQALTRSPFHPCSALDPASTGSPTPARPTHQNHLGQPEAKSTNNSSNNNNNSSNSSTSSSSNSNSNTSSSNNSGGPGRLVDPELFPYLAKRLAASELRDDLSDDSLDAMDAATAMLSLKHGPGLVKERRKRTSNATVQQLQLQPQLMQQQQQQQQQQQLQQQMVITSSPSEDHTYSAANGHSSSCHSPDEAFESEEDSPPSVHYLENGDKLYFTSTTDLEEQRKIAEGADALLNLAGIPTMRKRTYSFNNNNNNNNNNNISLNNNNNNNNNNEPVVKKKAVEEKKEHHHRTSHFRPRLLRSSSSASSSSNRRKNAEAKRKPLNNNILAKNNHHSNDWSRHRRTIEENSRSQR